MKTLAYTSQTGHDFITPLEAKKKNVGTVYSIHPAGKRLEMHVKRSAEKYYFAYTPQDRNSPGVTAPESLTHALCKMAIASLANKGTETKLKFYVYRDNVKEVHEVTVKLSHGENERTFVVNDKRFTVDVYCEFESCNPDNEYLSLSSKWNGHVAFEIYVTHGISSNDSKVRSLAEIGIPIIQLKIDEKNSLFLNETRILADSKTAKTVIENHIRLLENSFKKSIRGRLLRDIMSKEYEHELQMIQALNEKDKRIDELKHEVDAFKKKLYELQASNSEQRNICTSLREQNSELQQLLHNQSLKDATETEIEMPNSNSLLNRFLGRFWK